jgi:DNA repair protein RecO (recombination protein O)
MPVEKTTALVIRAVEFSETSLVVTLFTRDFGKIGALAKGARRLKSPFESALDLLALCRIVFLRKTSEALDLLTEAKLMRRFRPPGRNLAALYAAYYVAELLDTLTNRYDPHQELFDLSNATLLALANGESVVRYLLRFELQMLRILGHVPSLENCVECGGCVEPSGRVAFGLADGGVLCDHCRAGKHHVALLSAGSLRTMAQFAERDSQTWQHLALTAASQGELRGALNQYFAHLIGHRPRLQPYLASLDRPMGGKAKAKHIITPNSPEDSAPSRTAQQPG